ncbi:MAG: TauD/TfdA family dioxygenase [Sneathiella sp.]|nr:TauD/TfdA family dioxygenase [Sneathiella sp.]
MSSEFLYFDVTPSTPTLGATINNVNLAEDNPKELFEELKEALHKYKVIFFRDQDISDNKFLELGRHMGKLEIHEFFAKVKDHPEIQIIATKGGDTGTNRWHSDVTFRPNPSAASIIRARDIPPEGGGDTLWMCCNAAYNGLSDPIKELLLKVEAIHDMRFGMTGYVNSEAVEKNARENPPRTHPAIIAHPETGAPLLFVNSIWTSGFDKLTREESGMLLNFLYEHVKRPEFNVRFKWELNSIAIWDNLATQHYALGDYEYDRVMNRMIVDGVAPAAFDPQSATARLKSVLCKASKPFYGINLTHKINGGRYV